MMLRPDAPPADLYAGTLHVQPIVSSWLGTRQLATQIPVESGKFVISARTAVPERLDLVVARRGPDGTDWMPRHHDSPLARFGQYLDVALKITDPATRRSWTTKLGRCQIQDWKPDGNSITVSGVGMMQRLEDHKIGRPTNPKPGASLATEARRLISPTGLEVWIHPALADRRVPAEVTWGSDRMETLLALAEAWPARIRSNVTGQVAFLPPLPAEVAPVVTLTDGDGGTVVDVPIEDTRDGVYNHVIVRGKDNDTNGNPSFQEEAFATVGPFSVRTYGTVTKDPIVSDLVNSRPTARQVAQAELVKALTVSRILPVTMAPDYRLNVDVPVEVLTHDDARGVEVHEWGYVVGVEVPLTAADGDMLAHVGVYQ